MRWWPRSIRWQMLAALLLLELLSLGLFMALLVRQEARRVNERTESRLAHEATLLSLEISASMAPQREDWLHKSVQLTGLAPGVLQARMIDSDGHITLSSRAVQEPLDPVEKAQLALAADGKAHVFRFGADRWEALHLIRAGGHPAGFVLVESDRDWDHEQLGGMMRSTAIFGSVWLISSALLVIFLSGSITRPLAALHAGTRALMESPEDTRHFPLSVDVHNEIGDLVEAFNRMVASIEEQRAGLNDTLSLLDSMLANAPIGLAFFDRRLRFVRVNQVFAAMSGEPMSRHLGRTLAEIVPAPVAGELQETIRGVFDAEEPMRDLEFALAQAERRDGFTWLASAYPVRTTPQQVRWVGLIVLDASDRKRAEEALRRTEKLAATGRLAASIAHEINNPLEAITNLLYLLKNFCALDETAANYVSMAEYEARRITEITQQTLRFYRQSTLPTRSSVGELCDSVLSLFQGRIHSLGLQVEKRYGADIELFCYSGEIRQVIANLVVNALDASPSGGRLVLRARETTSNGQRGVRLTVADTGSGMSRAVRTRIFEAFFTTKEATGTGLGLWISHEIVVKHGGRIAVRSRATHTKSGTVFRLFLPDVAAPGTDKTEAIQG